MIGILHAYSRTNSGDGLLVDLTLDRLARCNVAPSDVVLVALDPDSFPEIPRRAAMGVRGRGLAWELVPAAGRAATLAASAATRRPLGALAHELAGCEALVAVGGGYLRAVDARSSIGTALNHVPQLVAAGRAGVPSLYLPQSIGPLMGPVGTAVRRGLRAIDAVCVRDPWSASDLADLPNVRQLPDLAVLELAESAETIEQAAGGGRVGFVARQVAHASGYEAILRAVAGELGDRAVWAVQTAGDPTKSDAAHYGRLGLTAGGGLVELLAARELSLVVSVRLHGALMALRAGVPAVHLAYDRKGPAAFGDLGLDEWCLDVRSLDRQALRIAVQRLLDDPQPYWERLVGRTAVLRHSSEELDALVRTTLMAETRQA
ncbi:MAG: polysaccharide pyruvyl transferase family protein [Acidimicrobiales bacterium]